MAALLLTTRATPQMYYGEEIGMSYHSEKTREEDVKDLIGKIGLAQRKGTRWGTHAYAVGCLEECGL